MDVSQGSQDRIGQVLSPAKSQGIIVRIEARTAVQKQLGAWFDMRLCWHNRHGYAVVDSVDPHCHRSWGAVE